MLRRVLGSASTICSVEVVAKVCELLLTVFWADFWYKGCFGVLNGHAVGRFLRRAGQVSRYLLFLARLERTANIDNGVPLQDLGDTNMLCWVMEMAKVCWPVLTVTCEARVNC